MAVLISKIVRGNNRVDGQSSSHDARGGDNHLSTIDQNAYAKQQGQGYFPGRNSSSLPNSDIKAEGASSITEHEMYEGGGIVKTVTMFLTEDDKEELVAR